MELVTEIHSEADLRAHERRDSSRTLVGIAEPRVIRSLLFFSVCVYAKQLRVRAAASTAYRDTMRLRHLF